MSSPSGQNAAWKHSQESEAAATLLADILTKGVKPTLADRVTDRVVDYLGWPGARYQRRRKWTDLDCQLLADTAQAVLDLRRRSHELVGTAIEKLLPPDTPRFHRNLVKKITEKLPLPWDAKLAKAEAALDQQPW